MRWTARWTRDRAIFLTGLAGVIYETLFNEAERPALLVLFASMLGLPAFLRRDEKEEERESGGDHPDEPRGG
jgi:hypothetical protein